MSKIVTDFQKLNGTQNTPLLEIHCMRKYANYKDTKYIQTSTIVQRVDRCNDPPVSEAAADYQEGDEANEEHNHEGNEASQTGIHLLFHLFHCSWLLWTRMFKCTLSFKQYEYHQ